MTMSPRMGETDVVVACGSPTRLGWCRIGEPLMGWQARSPSRLDWHRRGTPGHAMKVTDSTRAPGAIIGKAMSRLTKGDRGLVLVLVNLQ